MTCYNIQCMYRRTVCHKCMVKRRHVSNTSRNDTPGSGAEVGSNYLRSRIMLGCLTLEPGVLMNDHDIEIGGSPFPLGADSS